MEEFRTKQVMETQEEDTIDLYELFLELKKRWKLITVVTVLTTVIATVFTLFVATPMYASTAVLYMKANGETTNETLQDIQTANQLTEDYQELFMSRSVVEDVIKAEKLDMTVKQLSNLVTVTNPSSTHLLKITVEYDDADKAADIANAFVKYGKDKVGNLIDKEISLVDEAIPEYEKVSPSNTKNVLIGFLAGFVLSCGYIIVKSLVDDRLNSNDKIERVLGLNVLATFKEDSALKMDRNETKKKKKKKGNKK